MMQKYLNQNLVSIHELKSMRPFEIVLMLGGPGRVGMLVRLDLKSAGLLDGTEVIAPRELAISRGPNWQQEGA